MTEISEGALGRLFEDIATQLRTTIEQVIAENTARATDETAATLHKTLNNAGFHCDDTWCRNAIDTVRRGEPLTIQLP
ncbi:MAG: hypothetical protein QM747_17955 [Nocardioides sp.]